MTEVEKLTLELERAYREELKRINNWQGGETLVLSPVYFKIRDITCKLISLIGITETTRLAEKAYQFAVERGKV